MDDEISMDKVHKRTACLLDAIRFHNIPISNRKGARERFPLLSISIVGTSSKQYKTIFALSESLARLKKICKQKKGSNFMIE
jgi:hypothetical protein